jgi:hypothetical protein
MPREGLPSCFVGLHPPGENGQAFWSHQGVVGRMEVKAHDIAHHFHEDSSLRFLTLQTASDASDASKAEPCSCAGPPRAPPDRLGFGD